MATFVSVIIKTPRGTDGIFTYKVSEELEKEVEFGKRVEVTLRNKKIVALIVDITNVEPAYPTKPILRVLDEKPVFTKELYELSKWVSDYYVSSLSEVIYAIISFKDAKLPKVYELGTEIESKNVSLNEEQTAAIDEMKESIAANKGDSFYLWGITGSGKTEVYLSIADEIIKSGKSVIYLVPEIGLTHQLISQITNRFDKDRVAVLHSKLTSSQRLGEWSRIASGEVDIVLGARSAIFAPLSNLGLIIVDEEHDSSYKSDSFVRYNAKTVAMKRKMLSNSTLVLGSATPSLESYKAFKEGKVRLLRLKKRAVENSSVSEIQLVGTSGSSTIISPRLKKELENTIDEGKQAILFLNKRGFLHRLECPECGWTLKCPSCDVPLTYHKSGERLVCHHCNRILPLELTCKECGATSTLFRSYGTELIEKEVKAMLPFARVIRLDRDSTSKKDTNFETLAKDFRDKKADILIGTQMVAKGLNFPHVSLVGVINAMSGYTMNDFRSDERLFALLEQVAGRGGRFLKKSKVIVQSENVDAAPLVAVKNHDIEGFLDTTLKMRSLLEFPPFVHFARVIVRSRDEERAESINSEILNKIMEVSQKLVSNGTIAKEDEVRMIASSACPISKLENDFRFHVVVSSPKSRVLSRIIAHVVDGMKFPYNVRISIDIDPIELM